MSSKSLREHRAFRCLKCSKENRKRRGKRWVLKPPYFKQTSTKAAAKNRLYADYKNDARSRGLEWSLSKEEFFALVFSPCVYSGLDPMQRLRTDEGDLLYNGVDRLDSSLGYHRDNCVPCCGVINRAKNTLPLTEFTYYLKKIAEFWKDRTGIDLPISEKVDLVLSPA